MRWQGIWAGTDIFFPSQILFYIHGVPSGSRVCPGKGWELNRTNSEGLQTPHGNSATAWSLKVSVPRQIPWDKGAKLQIQSG